MNRLIVSTLALALIATTGVASAQSFGYPLDNRNGYQQRGYQQPGYQVIPDRYGQTRGAQYDYARVLRVDPVFDSYGSGAYNSGDSYRTSQVNGQNCYERDTYVNGNDGYYDNRGYDNRAYDNRGYRDDGRYDQYGGYRGNTGSDTGRNMATVIGGVLGAVVGSQVGGGSARYATSAIGSMVGGIAGRQVYEQTQRNRGRTGTGTVRVCDPVPADRYYSSNGYASNGYSNNGYSNQRAVNAYDVTYEYAGRRYTTRTNHHPGDRIRVRVDVRPY